MTPHRQRGFTLIEVLAALIIVSLGMLAVIQAVTQTVNNANYLREKTIAHWVAMNKLTEVRLAQTAPAGGETSGDVEMAGTSWHWRMAITATDLPTMQRIEIKVAPKSAGDDISIANVTGFFGSAVLSGGARTDWDIDASLRSGGAASSSGGSSSASSAGGSSSSVGSASSASSASS